MAPSQRPSCDSCPIRPPPGSWNRIQKFTLVLDNASSVAK